MLPSPFGESLSRKSGGWGRGKKEEVDIILFNLKLGFFG